MNRKLWASVALGVACLALGVASQVGRGQQAVPVPPTVPGTEMPELRVPDDLFTLPKPPIPTPTAAAATGTAPTTAQPLVYVPVDATGRTAPDTPRVEQASFTQTSSFPKIEGGEATGQQNPAVSIEWVTPPTARLNIPLPCQILVKNTSPSPVHQVTVTYPLPGGVTIKGCEPRAVNQSNVLTWSIGTLQPGQTQRIDLHLVATQKGDMSCNATVSFSGSTHMKLQVREPKLTMKVAAMDKVTVGENTTINFVIHNPGDGIADQVRVRTQLPEGLEHTRGRVLEFDVGNLAPQESRTVSLVCTAKGEGVQSVPLLAIAEGNLSVSEIAKLEVMAPTVNVALSGPKLRYLDRHAVFQFKVTNPSKATASKVTLVDILPMGFKFHAASVGGKFDPNTRQVSWAMGDLLPGQTKEVALDVIAVAAGDHKQVASAGAARGAKQEAHMVTRVEGIASLLIELSDVDDPVEVGTEACYEIRVVNTGTKMETNLQLHCTLPAEMDLVSAKCAAGCRHRQEGREIVFEPLPRLAPKADVIYRVTVRGRAAGDLRFRTHIRADGLTEPVLREESTRVYGEEIGLKQQ